ncbi:ParB/RepB/Spo0J family partition protein [Moraxella sp. ZJ142]|uniref:ParB/RepB/Spo0J family partition protein n=1 Tax=Moraxella marmotae TaxID=3344520 RepID=UPI0035D50590
MSFNAQALKERMTANIQAQQSAEKGVDQLLDKDTTELMQISLDKIKPNPAQPRKRFDESELLKLADSIQDAGLISPITVRKVPGMDQYHIVAGERRYRAHQMLNKKTISCVVIKINDQQNALMALAENLSRQDLTDYEIAKAVSLFEKDFPNRKEYAKAIGVTRQKLYRLLSFEKLPRVIISILEDTPDLFSCAQADRLATIAKGVDEDAFVDAALKGFDEMRENRLTESALPDFVKDLLESPEETEIAPQTRLAKSTLLKRTISVGGQTMGKIKQDAKKLTVELSNESLSDDKQKRLFDFLEELLNS